MDTTELAEYLADDSGDPYYELLIMDQDRVWWACNIDGNEIDENTGCPEHAPRDIPGLYRVDCEKTPPHSPMWVTDGDHAGYGVPCPLCQLAPYYEQDRAARQCQHWAWRKWPLTKWSVRKASHLGVISGYTITDGDGCNWCVTFKFNLHARTYILGVSRDEWRCWSRRHRRGEPVGFGYCGKCVPWTCCGSETTEHVAGCVEDVEQVRAVA